MDFDRLCLKCMKETIKNDFCTYCGSKKNFVQEPIFALPAATILHGRYLVGAVLGHGGFGITYLGIDLKNNQRVAIKEFLPDGISTRAPGTTIVTVHSKSEDYLYGRNQFIEEARTIFKCKSNPNIISVSSLFEENNTAYYIMEYLEGCDLKQYLMKRGGTLPYSEIIRLLVPIFGTLSAVHQQNVIHRDISPDNIYVCNDGQIKLLDFGAARVSLIGKSKSLSIILKRGYAPEEQYRSRGKQGPWTDIYALAATIYKCITGQLPLEATERLNNDELLPPSKFCTDIPAFAERALMKALAVKAEGRYQTMEEFKAALLGNVIEPPEKPPLPKPKIPEQNLVTSKAPVAVIGKRIVALFIDGIIIGVIATILLKVISVSLAGYYILIFLTGVFYGSFCEASEMSATLGKKIMGLKVVDAHGNKLDAGKVIMRNLIKYCPSVVSIFIHLYLGSGFGIINYGWALFNKKSQTIHDIAAGSLVVGKLQACEHSGKNSPGPKEIVWAGENQQEPKGYEQAEEGHVEHQIGKYAEICCITGHYMGVRFQIEHVLTLGRNPKVCNIIFPEDSRGVSGIHCEVYFDQSCSGVIIKDLNSTYGTLAGEEKLLPNQAVILYDGDIFTIGENNKFRININ